MQNNYGQPQQAPQQPQYQQYPGYPYPPQPKEGGRVFALLGFIFSLSAILLELIAGIVGGASGFILNAGSTVFVILMFIGFALASAGTVFSALALLKNKGKKLFAQIGLIAGISGVAIFIADLFLIIQCF